MLGAFGEARELSTDEMEMVTGMREQLCAQMNRSLEMFEPIAIKSQVVAGMNYWVKILVDRDEFIHVKIYRPLPYTHQPPEITEVEAGKTLDDPL